MNLSLLLMSVTKSHYHEIYVCASPTDDIAEMKGDQEMKGDHNSWLIFYL